MRLDHSTSVKAFAVWWLRNKPFSRIDEPVRKALDGHGTTLYRNGQFQVQMFVLGAETAAPEHIHPNVDSAEYLVNGTISFGPRQMRKAGPLVLIAPGEPHIAKAGPIGCTFISFQKWINDEKPTSVELDWVGEPLDAGHAKELGVTCT